ncbi:unnamed protein product [Lasius platythorax]|uniref:Uncharacterized protein n=1 Tax=Lasius platythorax TaxID=488582 RepID=A0AAV2NDV8_9HYME
MDPMPHQHRWYGEAGQTKCIIYMLLEVRDVIGAVHRHMGYTSKVIPANSTSDKEEDDGGEDDEEEDNDFELPSGEGDSRQL